MQVRGFPLAVSTVLLVGCGGGSAALGYALPDPGRVTYVYGDTTVVNVAAMGQNMEITMGGEAEYGIAFSPAADGVNVTLTVDRLAATVDIPMASTIRVDESEVEGPLVFTLDRRGRATVASLPTVGQAASAIVSGIALAHGFFPRLPGRSVSAGDEWVDTIAYEGDDELGSTESTILRYAVVGDTIIGGRELVRISFEGTSSVSNSMNMGTMPVSQSSTIDLRGHVLWDARSGHMFEMVSDGTGRGSVRVPMAPAPLPIEVRTRQRTRLGS